MHRKSDARSLALAVLQALERREAYADAAMDGLLSRHPEVSAEDRRLLTHLVYGVLRWRNRLDAHLALASSRPLRRIPHRLLDLLRLGAYQILFLDRIPARAAVSESVELARSAGLLPATGFVNAVLRRVAEAGPEIPLPADLTERIALLFGCPAWLVEAWRREHGDGGAEHLARAASRVPTMTLRVDTRRVSRDEAVDELHRLGLRAGPGEYAPEAVWVEGAGDLRCVPVVEQGAAVVQDQASQLVAHLLAPEACWQVLDLCAAPGLKAAQIAARLGAGGSVVAVELHPHRARSLEELCRRVGEDKIRVEVADGRTFRQLHPFDAAFVDAPCSGLGVLGRTPEAKWRRKAADLAAFPPLQLALLANAADLVRPGGVLVYATCTTLRAENEGVVEELLRSRPDFAVEPPPPGEARWEGLLTSEGYLRTFPDRVGETEGRALDGFFAARLRRGGPV